MIRCSSPARSFAVACAAAALVVSVAGCGGRGDELGRRTEIAPVTVPATETPARTALVVVTAPPTAPPTSSGQPSVDLDAPLRSIDTELAAIDAALQEFDAMTATTEGDPTR